MYASAWPSDSLSGGAPIRRQRAEGRAVAAAVADGPRTRIDRLAQGGCARVRLPRVAGAGLEAVIINTAGGLACGDRFSVEAEAGAGARLTVSTPAAEKVYRSDGETCSVHVSLRAGPGSELLWLPQETILFDRARIERRLDVNIAPDSRLLMFEALVFGRDAHGETMTRGHVTERWRIRRGDRLVYADALRLTGDLTDLLARPTVTGGMRALATLVYAAPDAAARLEGVRAALSASPVIPGERSETRDPGTLASPATDCVPGSRIAFGVRDDRGGIAAASSWNGLLAVRFLAPDIATLRRDAARAITCLTGAGLPRVWRT